MNDQAKNPAWQRAYPFAGKQRSPLDVIADAAHDYRHELNCPRLAAENDRAADQVAALVEAARGLLQHGPDHDAVQALRAALAPFQK